MYRLLLIEDDPLLRDTLGSTFDQQLYQITSYAEGPVGYKAAVTGNWDLIILDLLLPGKSGFLIIKQLRENEIDTPILVISGKKDTSDIITAFNLGADGYLCKPFNLHELRSRALALLKRPPRSKKDCYTWKELRLDCNSGALIKGSKHLYLPNKQYAILKYLFEHPESTVSKQELLNNLWEPDAETLMNTLDVHLSKMRKHIQKELRPGGEIIRTIHGKGYRLGD